MSIYERLRRSEQRLTSAERRLDAAEKALKRAGIRPQEPGGARRAGGTPNRRVARAGSQR